MDSKVPLTYQGEGKYTARVDGPILDGQIFTLQTLPLITPAYSASLPDIASPLTSCHTLKATWRSSKFRLHPGHGHLLPRPGPMPQYPSIGS